MRKIRPENLGGIYKDIATNLGLEIAYKIFDNYRGLQITFPTRFFSSEYVKQKVKEEYNGKNIKELSLKYSYSERTIRNMLSQK